MWIKEVNQKDDPGDRDHQPDATVPELGQVVSAIQRLGGARPPTQPV